MMEIVLSAIAIIAMLVFYKKAWRFVDSQKEDDSDLI
jgi:hypothetical protein